jgi:hypothetical protein
MTLAKQIKRAGWCNAYQHFSDSLVWPRGFPLEKIVQESKKPPGVGRPPRPVSSSIQQGLADESPDVDAIWRLVLHKPFDFEKRESIALLPGVWCPFFKIKRLNVLAELLQFSHDGYLAQFCGATVFVGAWQCGHVPRGGCRAKSECS